MGNPGNEVKARLYAMYYGHWCIDEDGNMLRINRDYTLSDLVYGKSYLPLRPIEQLTDEEKLIALTLNGNVALDLEDIQEDTDQFEIVIDKNVLWICGEFANNISFDYLRSIGIALPFTFLDENQQPPTASVTDQQSWGFIKLVEK